MFLLFPEVKYKNYDNTILHAEETGTISMIVICLLFFHPIRASLVMLFQQTPILISTLTTPARNPSQVPSTGGAE